MFIALKNTFIQYIFVLDINPRFMRKSKRAQYQIEQENQPMMYDNKNLTEYEKKRNDLSVTPFLIESLNPDLTFDKQWMVPIDQNYQTLQIGIIGHTNIIMGPSLVGKTGLVYFAKNQMENVQIIKIDCMFNHTPTYFASTLVTELSKSINPGKNVSKSKPKIKDSDELTRRMVLDQSIKLHQIDKFIIDRPKKYIILIKHAQKLVQVKKQMLLYNLFQWMKTDIKQKIGLVLVTKRLDFCERLQKRVKSRLNARIVTLYGPKDVKTVKDIINKRIQFAVNQIKDKNQRKIVYKFKSQFLEKNQGFDRLLQRQIDRAPKNINFYLEATRLALALSFSGNDEDSIEGGKTSDIQKWFNMGFEQARNHLCPYIKKQQQFLYNCNYPQYFVMAIIRVMLLQNKPKISFKQIILKYEQLKRKHGNEREGSFNFSRKIMQRAVCNLSSLHILQYPKDSFDFQNCEIISNMSPESIWSVLNKIEDKPQILKCIIDE